MEDYTIEYTDPLGRRWNLSTGAQGVLALADGVADLKSQRATEGLRLAGVPGQVVRPGTSRIEPVSATLRVLVDPGWAKLTMDTVWPRWVSAWSHDTAGRLEYFAPGSTTPRWMELRLGDDGLPQPERSPLGKRQIPLDVPVVSDSGLFFETSRSTVQSVTVTNKGVSFIWPRLRWKGAGGKLVLPSGAGLVIPPATAERVMYLDPVESGVVLTAAGAVDESIWSRIRPVFISEPVPPGKSRTFKTFAGATLEWDTGFDSPWRV